MLDYDGPTILTKWANGEIDGTTWHELLRSFIEMNELRICDALSEELSRALQVADVGLDPGFLPSLQDIRFYEEGGNNLFGLFTHARRVAGRPVGLLLKPSLRSRPIRVVTWGSGGGFGADHIVNLNNWLQSSPEGILTRELSWAFYQVGPNNRATHHATAKLRGICLGNGVGESKSRAKNAAAEQALQYLSVNGLPGPQDSSKEPREMRML
ncbi:hypothetical protein EI94DRAFT_1758494 [Lactarius quietus]|nr:hypothetical protein EI94DRAFT_1758494 [Lactarius quietus]